MSSSTGALISFHVSSSDEPAVPLGEAPLDRGEPAADRAQRLDREPALVRPGAGRDAVPGGEGGVEAPGVVDAEIGEPRPDPRLVDDAVAEVPRREHDVGLQRLLDDRRVGARPGHAREHADVPALDEPEAPRAAGDLRELPRQQVTPRLAVELRRLGEEQRLAGKVDAVAEHVGGHGHVGRAAEEAVDLLPPRAERHGAVENRDAVRVQPVDLAREREHRLAAERDDDRARA